MTNHQAILFSLIVLIFVFLVWGRVRYDLVTFAALVIAFVTGVVPRDAVFSGFGHPAVVIIALVLIVSRGLSRSGAIDQHEGDLRLARQCRRHRCSGKGETQNGNSGLLIKQQVQCRIA